LLVPSEPLAAADTLTHAARLRLRPFAIHPHYTAASPERIAAWHALGLRVHVWTVDTPKDAERLARSGVDAVITNVPDRILAVV
jgi:glycerophosphoryl diester phosphodiesterase